MLLRFTQPECLHSAHVIDWEFAGCAPKFVDVGHFCGQIFIAHLSRPDDSVLQTLIDSFLETYLRLVQDVDLTGIVGYVGAHVGSFGHYSWPTPEKRRAGSLKAVELVECASRGDFGKLQDGLLRRLFQQSRNNWGHQIRSA